MTNLDIGWNLMKLEIYYRQKVIPNAHFQFALWKDMFTGRLRSEIPPSLRSLSSAMIIANTQLIELDLSDNAFGPDGAEAIRSLLTSPVAYTIQTLKFQNNGLGGGGVVSRTLFCFKCSCKTLFFFLLVY